MEVFLARQPIFDRAGRLFAYELLYRGAASHSFDGSDGVAASLQVISNSLLSFGLDRTLHGLRGFVNCPRELLLDDRLTVLPHASIVLEVLEDVPRDPDVIAACRRLHDAHYTLALDDFLLSGAADPLLDIADIVKADFRAGSRADMERLARLLSHPKRTLLAEKVETREEFEWARDAGYQLFQGYFFAKPDLLRKREVPGFKLNFLRLLSAVQEPEIDFPRVAALIKRDVSLCERLLRYMNSGLFHWRTPVDSIFRAVQALGENDLRRWVSIAALPSLASDKPAELVVSALCRARFCEAIVESAHLEHLRSDAFLLGAFSHLDAMMDQPMDEVLTDFPLSPPVRQALLQQPDPSNRLITVYDLILAYQHARWEQVEAAAATLDLQAATLAPLYLEATRWADSIFGPTARP